MNKPVASIDASVSIYRIEYERLKYEQSQRIQFRDNLLLAHLTVVGAIVGFAITNSHNPLIAYAYLVVPWTSSIIGWAYLNNDIVISKIRNYLRDELSPRLNKECGVPHAFGWETTVRSSAGRTTRKLAQLFIDLAAFTVPAVAALCRLPYIHYPTNHDSFPYLVVADVVMASVFALYMFVWSVSELRNLG